MDFEIFAYINYPCNVIILFGVGVRFPQFALNRSGFFFFKGRTEIVGSQILRNAFNRNFLKLD